MGFSRRSWLILALVAILLIRLIYSIIQKKQDFFWFCIVNLALLIIGLYYNNNLIISSIAASSLFIEFFRTIDMISFFLTGKFLVNVAGYLNGASTFEAILNFYHFILIVVPLYYILKEKRFDNRAWIFSSLVFLGASIASFIFTAPNTNCARFYCDFGIFNKLYYLKFQFIPFVIFHWLMATILIFIPTHYLIKYIAKKIKAKDDYNPRHYRRHKQL